jgi:hypothetical protein
MEFSAFTSNFEPNEFEDMKFALREANSRNRYVPVIQNYKSYKETLNKLLQLEQTLEMILNQQNAITGAIRTVKEQLEKVIEDI